MIKFKSKEVQQKNMEHIANNCFKEAAFFMKLSLGVLIFDLFTYIIALQFNAFDFGIFFETFSLIFAALSIFSLNNKEISSSKINILLSTVPILFLQLYDIVIMFINWKGYLFNILFGYIYLEDILALTLILILIFNFISYQTLKKIGTDLATNGNKNWFYEEL